MCHNRKLRATTVQSQQWPPGDRVLESYRSVFVMSGGSLSGVSGRNESGESENLGDHFGGELAGTSRRRQSKRTVFIATIRANSAVNLLAIYYVKPPTMGERSVTRSVATSLPGPKGLGGY